MTNSEPIKLINIYSCIRQAADLIKKARDLAVEAGAHQRMRWSLSKTLDSIQESVKEHGRLYGTPD